VSRTVAFVCINGTGMGHATRILAIARRLPADVTPAVISNSPALDAFDMLPGAVVEHIPGHEVLEISRNAWIAQLRQEFDGLMRFYDCRVIVQDGTAIFPWVQDAVTGSDEGRRLAWIRRPMWRDRRQVYKNLQAQAFCDLVVEPGELAAEKDHGPTTRANELAPPPFAFVATAPIRLLDTGELLDRATARARLGIADGERAVLIQLGAGVERNWNAAAAAIAAARHVRNTRIFLARWKIAGAQPHYGEDVTVLDTYPLARFFNAFDLVTSATGYNSFHEIMASDLPAVFVPNQMEVDDQALRASYAAERGEAELVPANPGQDLAERLGAAFSRVMTRRSPPRPAHYRDNGAQAAADAIAALVPD
jgi:hypothetical protein